MMPDHLSIWITQRHSSTQHIAVVQRIFLFAFDGTTFVYFRSHSADIVELQVIAHTRTYSSPLWHLNSIEMIWLALCWRNMWIPSHGVYHGANKRNYSLNSVQRIYVNLFLRRTSKRDSLHGNYAEKCEAKFRTAPSQILRTFFFRELVP